MMFLMKQNSSESPDFFSRMVHYVSYTWSLGFDMCDLILPVFLVIHQNNSDPSLILFITIC